MIFITTGNPSALAERPASAADDTVAALGSGMSQAAQSVLHSSGESVFRPVALAASITARTAERS
jgi:hypothetical protein